LSINLFPKDSSGSQAKDPFSLTTAMGLASSSSVELINIFWQQTFFMGIKPVHPSGAKLCPETTVGKQGVSV